MGRKGFNGKLTNLDRQFVSFVREYQNRIKNDQDFKDKKYDEDEIISFAQTIDVSLRRKQERNLRVACNAAISYCKKEEEEDSDDSCYENDSSLMDTPHTNQLNSHLIQMYKKGQPPVVTPEIEKEELTLKQKRKNTKTDRLEAKKSKIISDDKWPTPAVNLSALGGIDDVAQELLQLIGMPLKHPEIFRHLGIDPPRGVLLHGPPGCGKTMLANAIAGEVGVPFINIAAPVIVSGMSGESEKKLREVFEEAKLLAPCIVFIDEIDAITPKRETAQREMERRIVAQLLTCMDDCSLEKTDYKPVIVIGATNRPDAIDPALRRAGRFDREITLGVPDEQARARILMKMCEKLKLDGDISFPELAKLTPGFVGADLNSLMGEAGMVAVTRIFSTLGKHQDDMELDGIGNLELEKPSVSFAKILENAPNELTESELEPLSICFSDFELAVKKVQPSSKREGFATVPGVSWDDIGALQSVRDELRMAIVEPIKNPEYFHSVGITSSMGCLLYGPPGCGKTLLAKAVANESHCNFLSVKGPELLNKYVGESERAIRMVFSRAQSSAPCVIFFDELDALCPARTSGAESQSASRLVNTLLTAMDGMNERKLVFVIAATNRPDMIDPAMLRPGRLDKALYVDLPNEEERFSILKTITRKTPLDGTVNLKEIARCPQTDGMSGADLASLVREAAVTALRATFYTGAKLPKDTKVFVSQANFISAFEKVPCSVNHKDRIRYELLKVKFGSAAD